MDDLSLSVIVAQLINFGIIFWIFKHFLGDSIISAIEERRKKLENLENSDALVKEKISEAEAEAKKLLDEARKTAQEMKQKNEELIKRDAEIRLQEAERKAEGIVESATRDVEKERGAMLEEVKNKVVDLSLKINGKIFGDASKNKEFIEKEVNSVKI
ncbi:ATP synthase F0 subunit B [Candidatus Gracilibacteria bacterium]|nr:ATP synthase F0 subunit B [Candidatus Gracilibacteria bacterium]